MSIGLELDGCVISLPLSFSLATRFSVRHTHTHTHTRYVALNTLCKVVERDVAAVNRHKNTIIECLKVLLSTHSLTNPSAPPEPSSSPNAAPALRTRT